MPVPTAPLGHTRRALAAVRHGTVVVAAALLFGPAAPLQAAPAEPTSPATSAPETDNLRALIQDANTSPPLRANAVIALSVRAGTDAIPTLLPYLQDHDEQIRITVARTLGRLGGAQVQQALEERLPFEQEPLVREALQQGLTFLVP